jgi:hypothetical protein
MATFKMIKMYVEVVCKKGIYIEYRKKYIEQIVDRFRNLMSFNNKYSIITYLFRAISNLLCICDQLANFQLQFVSKDQA